MKKIFFIVITSFIFLKPIQVEAITINADIYSFKNQNIDIIDGSGVFLKIFNSSSSDTPPVYSQDTYALGDRLYLHLPAGRYSILETNNSFCATYAECINPSDFINENLFTVTEGIRLNKQIYNASEGMRIISQGPPGGNPFQVYDFSTGSFVWGNTTYSVGDLIDLGLSEGSYAVLEATDYNCFYLSYDDCKNDPSFLKEVFFNVLSPASGGGGDAFVETISYAPTSYKPEIIMTEPLARALFSRTIPITYNATDQDDSFDLERRGVQGLSAFPVSLFYTDSFTQVSDVTTDNKNKTLIASSLKPKGTYIWNATGLLESKFYHIIARVVDLAGQITQAVSDYFTVDFTDPTFIISASPTVVKNESVKIVINSSEVLSKAPHVVVTQRGAQGVEIPVHISSDVNTIYEGVYAPVSGFDGTAHIEVSGTDLAGNIGSVVLGGGTFSIGINPPSKPVVTSPFINEKVSTGLVSVSGTTREDTEVVLTVNGVDIYKSKPDEKGSFTFKNIQLKKDTKNGLNTLSVVSKDILGAVSDSSIVPIFFNSLPKVSIEEPKSNTLVGGAVLVRIKAVDDNNDLLRFRYEIAPNSKKDFEWQTIMNVPYDSIYLDTTKFLDGEYMIRVVADDGMSFVTTEPYPIRIRNEASFFIRFFNGLHPVVRQNSALVRGVAYAEKNISPQPTIKSVEYSLTKGLSWIKVSPQDSLFDSGEERFEVTIKNLKNGSNTILWRTIDSRGRVATSEESITVDTAAPIKPEVLFPKMNISLTQVDNQTREKKQFVFTLRGSAEPETIAHVEIDGKKYNAQVSFDGTFRIEGIRLSKRGSYQMKVSVSDDASNISPVVEYPVVYNNPPSVVFVNPSEGRGLSGTSVISWISHDDDNDPISKVALSYRKLGKPFIDLAQNIKESKYSWNTSNLLEGGDYELRISISDGLSTTYQNTYFSIDKTIPTISSFSIKETKISKKQSLRISGTATDSNSGILFVEYRYVPISDNGVAQEASPWYKAILKKTSYKTSQFTIQENVSLKDGVYKVVLRAIDTAGNISLESSNRIYVDNTAPRIGSLEIVSNGSVVVPGGSVWNLVKGSNNKITISLEGDTKTAYIRIGTKDISLTKDVATGLWKGEFVIENIPVTIKIVAEDNQGNTTGIQNLLEVQKSIFEKATPKQKWWQRLFRVI